MAFNHNETKSGEILIYDKEFNLVKTLDIDFEIITIRTQG